ncbi:MAG: hypothetical protein ATN31_00020 [Candidatus Epulonipiscioides saccharophilum]|nr:MAG: hypothetical protein ATN31_00020 [Epulopiscium sp. AS2M-Bin001]
MKKLQNMLLYFFILFGSLIFLPTFIVLLGDQYNKNILFDISNTSNSDDVINFELSYNNFIQDQIIGLLAREVNYTESMEYLKLNAIIFRTYLLKTQSGQGILAKLFPLSIDEMKKKFGDNYEQAYSVYLEAINATEDLVILYNDELIEPVYHTESSGKTRNGLDVYGIQIDYLKAVDSPFDTSITELKYTDEQIITKLRNNFPNIIINNQYLSDQIQIIEVDNSGYIKSIQFGSSILDESSFLQTFGLTSSNVDIIFQGNNILFRQHGIGSGVGLSQNSAKEYSNIGHTYDVILKYYYYNTEIKKIAK